jgi:hypothetical protein
MLSAMIHIATVHWSSDRWIDVQLRYLERHVRQPFQVYAAMDGIETDHRERFHFSGSMGNVQHPVKLNRLAERIAEEAAADDLLVFLDGDAFPIASFDDAVPQLLDGRPLAAIRRDENVGDPQPHPSFCVTTMGFWQEIGGDWSRGQPWKNAEGEEVDDVGGKVMKALADRGIEWSPILRTNVKDLHPILFGVYGDVVYHHGAGFRSPLSRWDLAAIPRSGEEELHLQKGTPEYKAFEKHKRLLREDNEKLSEIVYERIVENDDFARELFLS